MARFRQNSGSITLAPKKLILTRRASEGSASEPSLARRVSMCKDAKLSCRGNKNKASKATPAIDNCKGRVQRKVLVERGARFRCFNRCLHRKGAPDGKPTPNAETERTSTATLQQAGLTLGQETASEIAPDPGNNERTRQRKPGITSSPDSSSS